MRYDQPPCISLFLKEIPPTNLTDIHNSIQIFHTQSTYQNCTYRNHRNQIDTDTMTYTPGTYVPPHLRSKQKKEADPESQATTPATANLDPSAPVFKSSSVKSSSRTSAITVSTFAPSETKVQPLFDDLESATNFDFLYNKVKATTSSAASTVTPSQSNHSRSASIQPQLTSDRAQSPSNNSQASGKPTSSAGGRALATSFSQWAS
jgi:hypothetical protein